jgi:V/A-type H+-transporting ATPase subunit I
MPLPDALSPVQMRRVAIVAIESRLRDTLALVADSGSVELDGELGPLAGPEVDALRRLERAGASRTAPAVTATRCDLTELEQRSAWPLLAGEAELCRRAASAIHHGPVAGLVGWMAEAGVEPLRERLGGIGAAVVELPPPPWSEPPTQLRAGRMARPFRPLVDTYGPARYRDVDPTAFTAATFILMFGMMFGDVGHGLLLALFAVALLAVRRGRLLAVRRVWPLLLAAGVCAALFGLLYGEFFGPTGVVPTLWLDPVDDAPALLLAGVAIGAVLLMQSYAFGTVNRWREEGPAAAVVAPSGVAGTCVFVGGGLAAAGWYAGAVPAGIAGALIAAAGLALLATGYAVHAGRGGLAALEVSVEVVDAVIRTLASVISFTRLAAFGVMHAALGIIVWGAATSLWGGLAGCAAAIVVLIGGNLVAFSLELLVAGVQALRLEYYELFSRIFAGEGRAFSPWHIPLTKEE